MREEKTKRGERVEKPPRRLKKKMEREGTPKKTGTRRHYEKPSEKKRRRTRRSR